MLKCLQIRNFRGFNALEIDQFTEARRRHSHVIMEERILW